MTVKPRAVVARSVDRLGVLTPLGLRFVDYLLTLRLVLGHVLGRWFVTLHLPRLVIRRLFLGEQQPRDAPSPDQFGMELIWWRLIPSRLVWSADRLGEVTLPGVQLMATRRIRKLAPVPVRGRWFVILHLPRLVIRRLYPGGRQPTVVPFRVRCGTELI